MYLINRVKRNEMKYEMQNQAKYHQQENVK